MARPRSCSAIGVFGICLDSVNSSALLVLGACMAMSTQWLSFGLHNYQSDCIRLEFAPVVSGSCIPGAGLAAS